MMTAATILRIGAAAMALAACASAESDRRSASAPPPGGTTTAAASGATATAPSGDALVTGTGFNATGEIRCTIGGGQQTAACPFGVIREGNGSGIVAVTKPDGQARAIFFDAGRATGYDASEADRATFRAEKQSDLTIVTIGDERYEIPDAVIYGG